MLQNNCHELGRRERGARGRDGIGRCGPGGGGEITHPAPARGRAGLVGEAGPTEARLRGPTRRVPGIHRGHAPPPPPSDEAHREADLRAPPPDHAQQLDISGARRAGRHSASERVVAAVLDPDELWAARGHSSW